MRKTTIVALYGADGKAAVPVADVSEGVALLERVRADGGRYKGKAYEHGCVLSNRAPYLHKERTFWPTTAEGGEG